MGPQELLAEYERRLGERTFDAVEPLISPTAVFWFNDGSYSGLTQIRGAFERTFAAFPLERYWLEEINWIASGDASAACLYRFRWKATNAGLEVTGGGRGTTVMRLEGGAWKIVHEHLSQQPA
jgi:ketosteroid isomerase-like protein